MKQVIPMTRPFLSVDEYGKSHRTRWQLGVSQELLLVVVMLEVHTHILSAWKIGLLMGAKQLCSYECTSSMKFALS